MITENQISALSDKIESIQTLLKVQMSLLVAVWASRSCFLFL
jgi:hypothetical protein